MNAADAHMPEAGQPGEVPSLGPTDLRTPDSGSGGFLSTYQQKILRLGGYRMLSYGKPEKLRPCGREEATGSCRYCHPDQNNTHTGKDPGGAEAEITRLLLDKIPQDGTGARIFTDRFAYVDFPAVVALLAGQTPPAKMKEVLLPGLPDAEAAGPNPLRQLLVAVDEATDGLVSELLAVPRPQSAEAASGPVTMHCQRQTSDSDEDYQITITHRSPAGTTRPAGKATANTVLGAVTLATFEAVEDMSQMPPWFGWGTSTIAALPYLPDDAPVVVLPVQSHYDDVFKDVLAAELGDRSVAEIVYASVIWGTSCAWSGFEGVCEAHLQACCALGALGIAMDYVLEPQALMSTEAVQTLACTSVPSYLGPDAQYMKTSVALAASAFARKFLLRILPPGPRQGPTAPRVTPTEFMRSRWFDAAIYAWLASIEQARSGEVGTLSSTVTRAMGQCTSTIAAYDVISRINDPTDVWTDAQGREPYNELLQAVRHGYRGSFVAYTRAVAAIVDAVCACTCTHEFHADAADVCIALCTMMPLLPRYNTLAQHAAYRCGLPEMGGDVDVFVCRPIPADLDRMIFTPDWQLMPWVIKVTGDSNSTAPPEGSEGRAPRQWANRIVDHRRNRTGRDAVQNLLAQGPQFPSAYCAHDRVLRVLETAAPQAAHSVLHDAATLITDMWDLAVELHHGRIPPATAARASSLMYLQLDKVTYAAVSRHHNTTATALQRATIGYLSCILQLTGFQHFDTLVANPHIKRHIQQTTP